MNSHDTRIRVRYEDADPMGFLHHSKYFTYFEIGRTEAFRAQGGDYRALEASGHFVVVVRAECRYSKPARYDDELIIRMAVARVTAAKIEHRYEMWRGETRLATATVILALVDRKGVVQRIPDWLHPSG